MVHVAFLHPFIFVSFSLMGIAKVMTRVVYMRNETKDSISRYLARRPIRRYPRGVKNFKSELVKQDWLTSYVTATAIRRGEEIPWLTYGAIDYLHQHVSSGARVLEVGAGNSTIWWAKRGCEVVAIEQDAEFAAQVRASASSQGLEQQITVHCLAAGNIDDQMLDLIASTKPVDVAINDGIEPRGRWLPALADALNNGGTLVFDNSERVAFQDDIGHLEASGWIKSDFFGPGPINPYTWETSVFNQL